MKLAEDVEPVWKMRNSRNTFPGNLKGRCLLRYRDVDEGITLKWIVDKYVILN